MTIFESWPAWLLDAFRLNVALPELDVGLRGVFVLETDGERANGVPRVVPPPLPLPPAPA
jgi:hypothetical protein